MKIYERNKKIREEEEKVNFMRKTKKVLKKERNKLRQIKVKERVKQSNMLKEKNNLNNNTAQECELSTTVVEVVNSAQHRASLKLLKVQAVINLRKCLLFLSIVD